MKRNFLTFLVLELAIVLFAGGFFLVLTRIPNSSDVHSGLIGAIIGAIITVLLILVAWWQLGSMNRTSSADFLHKLKIDFFTDSTRTLIHLLDSDYLEFIALTQEEAYFKVNTDNVKESGLPSEIVDMLTARKAYSVCEIDDYVLNHLEDLGYMYKQKLLTRDMVYDQFSYFLEVAFDNSEIKKYVAWQRNLPRCEDIFSDAEELYDEVKQMEPGATSRIKKGGHMNRRLKRGGIALLVLLGILCLVALNSYLSNRHLFTYATGTKDKAFLNATWKMSPQEIERANSTVLSSPLGFPSPITADVMDQKRFQVLLQKEFWLWGHESQVEYQFFDSMLYEYCVLLTVFDIEKSHREIFEMLRSKFGKERDARAKGSDLLYDFEWETEKQAVSYWMGHNKGKESYYVGIRARYKPFYADIEKIGKDEKKSYF